MKNLEDRIAEYHKQIDSALVPVRESRTWVIERYPEAQVVPLKGEIVLSNLPPNVQQMIDNLDAQELSIKQMVADAVGVTLKQVGAA